MIDIVKQAGFDTEGFQQFLASRQESDWITQNRRDAWTQFCELDWPGRRDEEWMRTDIRLFKLEKYGLSLSRHQ